MITAVILGTHTMGLGVIRALGSQNVPITTVTYDRERDFGFTSRYVKEKLFSPDPEKNGQQFIDFLLDSASHLRGSFLVPVSDATLEVVSRHKTDLEKDYIVACTEWDITKLYLEKKYTYRMAETLGILAPKTIFPLSSAEVEEYGQSVKYPCLVKPCKSHNYLTVFKRKMVKVNNLEEMISAYTQASNAGLEVVIQEFIPGDDYCGANYNSYFVNGEARIEFTATKIRSAPPELGSPCVVLSKKIPEVFESGRKILKAMGFYGYSCTEFKRDPRDGLYKLMEVNGRHNLSTSLAVRCGINFPWLHYKHLVLGEEPTWCDFKEDIYWIDLERDLAFGLKNIQSSSLQNYARPYFSNHIYAVLDTNDLNPFLKRWKLLR